MDSSWKLHELEDTVLGRCTARSEQAPDIRCALDVGHEGEEHDAWAFLRTGEAQPNWLRKKTMSDSFGAQDTPRAALGGSRWTRRWLDRAQQLASWSKDPTTRVGCVLVRDQHAISEGYNGFPHGFNDAPERFNDRTTKYRLIVHAEENAIAHAARYGHNTRESIAFTTYPCCSRCATLLVQAGIRTVIVDPDTVVHDRFRHEAAIAARIFQEAGIPYNWSPSNLPPIAEPLEMGRHNVLGVDAMQDVRYVRLLNPMASDEGGARDVNQRWPAYVALPDGNYRVYEWLSDREVLVHIAHAPEGL